MDSDSHAPSSERGTSACNICVGVERTVNVTLAYKVCLQTAVCLLLQLLPSELVRWKLSVSATQQYVDKKVCSKCYLPSCIEWNPDISEIIFLWVGPRVYRYSLYVLICYFLVLALTSRGGRRGKKKRG